ncbi:thioredoxin family protein [Stenotrophomonas sp. YIM B06876]|uniref:thioredoxin family protein n=1 Tax=Stenotrophomonas sp. YIM B06876 TaxID=3060211 RepID=UPI002738D27E|nr:thioredoxin family protein [Stenotrophomonas sp. YIM B06876]
MKLLSGMVPLLLTAALAGCNPPPPAAPEKAQPLDTSEQKTAVADVREPVVSGNTPAAADIAAIAALNAQFDPARDPAADLEMAKVEAQRGGKRIVLDVGGEWCSWCHLLDAFMEGDAEIRRFRDANYVWMKVNYSEDNENTAFLSRFPEITGYPHLFVLDADGQLLHSQFTGELEKGKGYDRGKLFAFLKAWAPGSP